ncbi:MAG: NeuD/PglB/VioB family sugar acetyltransferase [Deltaproteobacteria bacterium]|jgi:sugar O-acyltransferase (sialic acid O-acetyltransferase NeuD family)|nr:NeuD/PglB/VioB family sugar acetyltransferase [Deltaproteobacteria bacterium]
MRKKLIILGSVGTCLDLAESVLATDDFELLGFLDDNIPEGTITSIGKPVLGTLDSASKFSGCNFINAIGSPKSYRHRENLILGLNIPQDYFANIIHPKACLSASLKMGAGNFIFANSSVGANVQLDNHISVLQNSVIGHDSIIESYVIIAAGVTISGRVKISKGAYIGAGSTFKEDVIVGEGTLVGAGSVVVNNLPPQSICYGVPAVAIRAFPQNFI